jgi:hypothetical protein
MTTEYEAREWNEQKNLLQNLYPVLTDSDLRFKDGKMHAVLHNLQMKLCKTKDELLNIISTLK